MKIDFRQVDKKFNVRVGMIKVGGDKFFFFKSPNGCEEFIKVPHANIVLVGNVGDATAGLISNYTNAELHEMIGISPTPLAKLRKFLGVGYELGKNPKEQ